MQIKVLLSFKMKNLLNITSALFFSTLFYKQTIGLNLLLFTIVTICTLSIIKYEVIKKQQHIILLMGMYLLTGIMAFFHNSNLVITVNIITFFTFVGSFSESKASIYILWLNGVYTSIVSVFEKHFNGSNSEENKTLQKRNINFIYWIKIMTPIILIVIMFTYLYSLGNPLFKDLISEINIDFINFQWILLSVVGFYLFNNITNPIKIEPATELDLKTDNNLYEDLLNNVSKARLSQENQLGTILMLLLNVLIGIYIVTDIIFIKKIQYLNAVELSQQVHSGINSLIISIVFAIIIILYFFRGDLNFFNKNKNLKTLTFIWIFLNLILSLITVYKNFEYLNTFGLTYKRIGVLIYLMLTIIGLISTFIKVYSIKNFWFLLRKNFQIAFILLILSTTINWDILITKYNINYAKQTDFEYLINLSNNNTFMLKSYADSTNTLNENTTFIINNKYDIYTSKLETNSWKEMVFDNLKIKK